MSVHVTDEVHEGVHVNGDRWTEHERFVSGDHSSASVYDDHIYLTIGGMPDLELNWARIIDLHGVLGAALGLHLKYVVEHAKR